MEIWSGPDYAAEIIEQIAIQSRCNDLQSNTFHDQDTRSLICPAGLDYEGRSTITDIPSISSRLNAASQKSISVRKLSPAELEFEKAKRHCPILASTGCSARFCQAGRSVHTDEPRVGENRDIQSVLKEAAAFLMDMFDEGFFPDIIQCETRIKAVSVEIHANAREGIIRSTGDQGLVGGYYHHTAAELEFGLRRSWLNSRKCIMRSQYSTLAFKDLRNVTSSLEMATEVIAGVREAFNNGAIKPTVFVFPPRAPNQRGPMIISQQVFAFAGYEQPDGRVVGDPANVQLTKDIIDLGWTPPKTKSRWDLLPLVTLADGDAPAIVELPQDLRKVVHIRHPRYQTEFETLDLKWVAAPALCRLGFDIGGVQYTATPFMGWFMDSEIAIRNLSDSFRYNVLPDVVGALRLKSGSGTAFKDLDSLPEYEKLVLLSTAQAELNYAVMWSFLQAGITITDSLSASASYCDFDDAYREKHGHRLPADPYWLAPPQGSIIPVWHRGGAPNYQPKPMIAKHVMDPIRAWQRQVQLYAESNQVAPNIVIKIITNENGALPLASSDQVPSRAGAHIQPALLSIGGKPHASDSLGQLELGPDDTRISILYCTSGSTAKKLADHLRRKLQDMLSAASKDALSTRVKSVDNIEIDKLEPRDVLLLVVSSTGQGDVPPNGQAFYGACRERANRRARIQFRFSIFGNGDSRYTESYNGAAVELWEAMTHVGGSPLGVGLVEADTAVEAVPFNCLDTWIGEIRSALSNGKPNGNSQRTQGLACQRMQRPAVKKLNRQLLGRSIDNMISAMIVSIKGVAATGEEGSRIVTLDLGFSEPIDFGCIQLLPWNDPAKVQATLLMLRLSAQAPTLPGSDVTNERYLTQCVDLEAPFESLKWFEQSDTPHESFQRVPAFNILQRVYEWELLVPEIVPLILLSFAPLGPPRTYSIASFASSRTSHMVDIMVKRIPGGRFSDILLDNCVLPAFLQVRFMETACTQTLQNWQGEVPLIAIATGAGFGPVRALLQRQIAIYKSGKASTTKAANFMTVFVGVKENDVLLVSPVLDDAVKSKVADFVGIISSNPSKRRVQDLFQDYADQLKLKILRQKGLVFVCTGSAQANAIIEKLGQALEGDARKILGDRLIQEIF